jgi:hypothetical protein
MRVFFFGDHKMLKAQVGLSRKISHNYNSSGYTVSLEAEVGASLDQPDAVREQIDRLFELAEQALQEEISRDRRVPKDFRQKADSTASGDAVSSNLEAQPFASPSTIPRASPDANPHLATSRQLLCIRTLGDRRGWSTAQIEEFIAEILSVPRKVSELDKKEASKIIQELLCASGNGKVVT